MLSFGLQECADGLAGSNVQLKSKAAAWLMPCLQSSLFSTDICVGRFNVVCVLRAPGLRLGSSVSLKSACLGSRFTGELSQAELGRLRFYCPLWLLVSCVICGGAYKDWRLKKEKSYHFYVGINPEASAPGVWEEGRATGATVLRGAGLPSRPGNAASVDHKGSCNGTGSVAAVCSMFHAFSHICSK